MGFEIIFLLFVDPCLSSVSQPETTESSRPIFSILFIESFVGFMGQLATLGNPSSLLARVLLWLGRKNTSVGASLKFSSH